MEIGRDFHTGTATDRSNGLLHLSYFSYVLMNVKPTLYWSTDGVACPGDMPGTSVGLPLSAQNTEPDAV